MNESDQTTFRAEMIDDAIRFAPVIRHAAGLGRNDKALLEVIGKQLSDALTVVTDSVDTDSFDRLLGHEEQQEANLELLRQQLAEVTPAKPDDETTDRWHEIAEDNNDEDNEDPAELDPLHALGEHINLLTAVLRASEFVNDTSLKAELVEISIEAQGILGAVPAAAEEETHGLRDLLNEILRSAAERGDAVPIKEDEIEHTVRTFFATMLIVATLVDLGSPSLGAGVIRAMDNGEFMTSPTHAFLITVLACYLEQPNWARALIELHASFPDHPFLKELVRNIATRLYRSTKDASSATLLEPFLTELYAPDTDGRTPVRSQVRSQLKLARTRAQIGPAKDDELDEIPGDEVLGTPE